MTLQGSSIRCSEDRKVFGESARGFIIPATLGRGKFGSFYLSCHCRETFNIPGNLNFARETKAVTPDHILVAIGPASITTLLSRGQKTGTEDYGRLR